MMMERDAGLGPVPEDLDLPGDAAARDPGLAVLSDEALLERLAALGEPCVEGVLYAADLAHEVLAREQGTRDPARRDRLSAALERALAPALLDEIARSLTSDPERYNLYVDLLERAGEAGAAAVVDRMGEAQTIAERRLYFDLLHSFEAAVPALVRMLGDPRWYVVRNAAELLGHFEAAGAERLLAPLLSHDDERVRRAAAVALAKIGTPVAQSEVRAALADDGASGELASALLGQPGEDGSLTRLFEALDQERDQEMLKAVFMALGRHASRAAVERLARAARGIDPRTPRSVEVRIAAVEALGEAGTPESIAALRSLLHDPEERVRGAALWVVTDPRSPSRP